MRRQLCPKVSNLYASSPLITSFSHNTHVDVGDSQTQAFFPVSNFTFSMTCWVFLPGESQAHSVQSDCICIHWNPAPPLLLPFSVYAIIPFLSLLNCKSQVPLLYLQFPIEIGVFLVAQLPSPALLPLQSLLLVPSSQFSLLFPHQVLVNSCQNYCFSHTLQNPPQRWVFQEASETSISGLNTYTSPIPGPVSNVKFIILYCFSWKASPDYSRFRLPKH